MEGKTQDKRIFLTTPIYYVNATPHLGHAYTTIVVDGVARFYRIKGFKVFFLTGTDEHGDKIQKVAKDKGVAPKCLVDEVSQRFKDTWRYFKLSFNDFIRTTEDRHKKVVQYVLQKLYDKGEIYLDEYEGHYCVGCERFLTRKELDEKGCCPDHKAPPIYIKEKNYFFNLEKYRVWLRDYLIKENFIYPEFYREEVLKMLEEPLPPLCISRPKTRLTWGIELPFDKDYVTYVWFDALINYLTAIGYPENPEWEKWWKGAHHFIAKDILKPHAVYWPIMLKAMEVPMYKKLLVHGYWLVDKLKMSKSIGNIIDPVSLAERFGRDQLRYFLFREMAFGYDSEFSLENFINRINSDLANDYGNLIYRTLALITKHFDAKIPELKERDSEDISLLEKVKRSLSEFGGHFSRFEFHHALEKLWEGIRECNVYIDRRAPWKLIKDGQKEKAGSVLRNLLEVIKSFAIVLYPVMPESSLTILKAFGLSEEDLRWENAFNFEFLTSFKEIPRIPPLFPRVEVKREEISKEESSKEKASERKAEYLDIKEFQKWDFRVGEVVFAEKIKGTDRLLRLEVLCPEKRQIVSGIAEYYKPEELIGKKVIIVTNLKPIKIRGVLSEGMLLAADDGENLSIVGPEREVKPGAKVK